MPTMKPRVYVTLDSDTHAAVVAAARASGDSASKIIAELVAVSAPALRRMAAILEAANKAPSQVRDGLAAALEGFQREIEPKLVTALGGLERGLGEVEAALVAAEPPREPRSRRRSGRKTPAE